jgi:hypothetical protein
MTRIITNSWINWCEVSEISVSNLVAAALAFFPSTSTDPWYPWSLHAVKPHFCVTAHSFPFCTPVNGQK